MTLIDIDEDGETPALEPAIDCEHCGEARDRLVGLPQQLYDNLIKICLTCLRQAIQAIEGDAPPTEGYM